MADIDIYKAKLPQDDTNLYRFRDGVIEPLVDTSYEETDYANPLTLETLQAQVAKDTKIKIDPIQDLHGYDKPWVGGAGKNLLPHPIDGTYGNVVVTNGDNGSVSFVGNCNINTSVDFYRDASKLPERMSAGATYTMSVTNLISKVQVYYSTDGESFLNQSLIDLSTVTSAPFTIPSNATGLLIRILVISGIDYNVIIYPQVESGSLATTYEPYENICPISGHDQIDILGCGKNLLTGIEQGGFNTLGIDSESAIRVRSEDFTDVRGVSDYTISSASSNIQVNIFEFTEPNTDYIGTSGWTTLPYSFTKNSKTKYIRFMLRYTNNGNITPLDVSNVQFEKGSSATTYEPYTESNNKTLPLPSTVYGGVLDLESGELVVDEVRYKISDFSWDYYSPRFEALGINYKGGTVRTVSILSSAYECISDGRASSEVPQYCIYGNEQRIFIHDARYNNVSNLISVMGDETICYELAAPFTIYISPEHLKLFKAQNNLTTSQYTQVKVTYRNGVFATLEELSDTAQDIYDEISGDSTTVSGNPINFTTREKQKAKSTIIDLEPIQDLHGFTKPWVGGAGKNKLVLDLDLDKIKSYNTSGTWSGNAYTLNNITFTILTDSDGNITGIKTSGTPNANTNLYIYRANGTSLLSLLGSNISYILNGNPSGGSATTYYLRFAQLSPWNAIATDTGSGSTFSTSSVTGSSSVIYAFILGVDSGTNVNNYVFYPMLRLSTVTDATFEPYTNICSISGRSEVNVDGCGKNLLKLNQLTATTINGLTMTPVYSNGKLDYLNFNGTLSATTDFVIGGTFGIKQRFIFLGKGITYTFSRLYKNTGVKLLMRDGAENVITPNTDEYTFTLDKDTEIGSIFFRFSAAKYENIKIYPQLEVGSSASLYEPYTPSTDLTISFGTTVYGGRLDVEKGELVVDRKYKLYDGSSDEEWVYSSAWSKTNTNVFYNNVIVTDAYYPSEEFVSITNCNRFKGVSRKSLYDADTNGVAFSGNRPTANFTVRILKSTVSSLEDFNTWIASNNIEIIYVLNTPTTIQLTPHQIQLLKGINNISTDGTTITVTYKNGSVAHLDDLPENVFTDDEKEKLNSIDTLAVTLDLLTHTLVITQDI